MIRRIVLAAVAFFASSLPALAQSTSMGAMNNSGTTGGSLFPVWGWILIAGFLVFGIGTSLGAGNRR